MEYEFIRGLDGQARARLAMGQEVFGRWLSEELGGDLVRIEALLASIDALQRGEQEQISQIGRIFSLHMEADEVELMDNALHLTPEEGLEPELHYYDDESMAGCGLEDLAGLLRAWRAFLLEP